MAGRPPARGLATCRQRQRVAITLIHRKMQAARRTASPHGIVFSLLGGRGQVGKAEPSVVVTTNWAVEAFVPSRVTDGGVTVQEAQAGGPEQPNTTT